MTNRRPSRATLCLLTVAVAACGTSTDPDIGPLLDTDAALEDYATLEAVLSSPEFAGFQVLGSRTPFATPFAGADIVAAMTAPSAQDGGRAFAGRLAEALVHNRVARNQGPLATQIISGFTLGKTFVYDPVVDDYRHDPERTGAPENGVRFIMYEVDEGGAPIVENEIGYADLLDEGEGSVEDIVLRLLVVHMDETVLDYRTTLDILEGGGGGTLTVGGFLVGDGTRLDFDIAATGRETAEGEMLDVDFDLSVDARQFSIVGQVTGIDESDDDAGQIDVTVTHGTDSIRVDVAGVTGLLEGTIFVNGEIFVTVSGPESDPVFQDATGQPLTLGELIVLRKIFETLDDVFTFLEDLLDPVEDIVFLGIIL